jgi:hypothetical protein
VKRRISAGSVTTHPRCVGVCNRQDAVAVEDFKRGRFSDGAGKRLELGKSDGAQIERPLGMTTEAHNREPKTVFT